MASRPASVCRITPLVDQEIYMGGRDARGIRDRWMLSRDLETGEEVVRHDQIILNAHFSGRPHAWKIDHKTIADFLSSEIHPNVKLKLQRILEARDTSRPQS